VNTGIGCPEYTPGLPVTAVISESATQVALGALTSSAEGAMVKFARFGTVRAFPPEFVDVIGCPTTVSGLGDADAEAEIEAGSVEAGGASGSLVTVPAGVLTATAESELDGRGAPDADALLSQLIARGICPLTYSDC
jgi:hypothetical protein